MLNSSVNGQRINTANSLSGAAPLSCKPKGPAQGQRPARPLAGACLNNRISRNREGVAIFAFGPEAQEAWGSDP